MKKSKKYSIEMRSDEYNTLVSNPMIESMCKDQLASPKKRGGYILLRLTEGNLEELIGFVAAEANHAKTRKEEEALGDVFDNLEGILFGIRMGSNR